MKPGACKLNLSPSVAGKMHAPTQVQMSTMLVSAGCMLQQPRMPGTRSAQMAECAQNRTALQRGQQATGQKNRLQRAAAMTNEAAEGSDDGEG
jgi:hypothetical protein